jgi:cathepsin D
MPNAMAIDQDGNDYTYFSTMKFGSKDQEMYMLIDSGSANTWVMGSNCKSYACQTHNTFGSEDSTTLKTTTQTWSMTYGTGEVDGVVAKDTVQLANYTVNMNFGLASTASDDFNNYPMDGILGLGRATSDALDSPTIMQVLNDQGHLAENILGIHLQRSSDGNKDGQITFGGVDSSKFAGKLSYSKTITTDSWQIPADDAGVDGKAAGFKGKTAIIDTGTSYILMPPADADALHQLIPGSSQNGERYVVPCSSSANVYFTISGVKYSVSPKDYVGKQSGTGCQSNIIGHQPFGPDDWILGDVFLKNVYTVLDFDHGWIGFGTKTGAGASTSSTATTSSVSSTGTGAPSSSGSSSSVSSRPSPTSSSASSPTTFATSTTGANSATAAGSSGGGGAAATSSAGSEGSNSDSDPFSQAGDTGSSSGLSSSSSSSATKPRSSSLIPIMALAFAVGFIL